MRPRTDDAARDLDVRALPRMGLFDRLKDLAVPPAPRLDTDEDPPWLRDAVAESMARQPGAPAAGPGSADPYRRAPQRAREWGKTAKSSEAAPPASTPSAPAPPAFSPPPAAPPAFSPPPAAPPAYQPPPAAPAAYSPPPAAPPAHSRPPAPTPSGYRPPPAHAPPPTPSAQTPSPTPAQPPAGQRPWYASTLPPGQEAPVPWFARPTGAPAAPPAGSAAPPPAPTAPTNAPPPAYSPPPPPPAYKPPPTPPAYQPPAAPTPPTPPAYQPPPAPTPPTPPAYTPPPSPPAYAPPPPPPPSPPAYTPPPRAEAPPPASPAPPAAPHASHIVKTITDVVLENWRTYPLDDETLSLLQIGLPYLTQRDCSADALLAGQTAARLGYIARAAEYAEFPGARQSDPDLLQELSESLDEAERDGDSISTAMAEFAADLAVSEPIDPPASDGGPSWIVPGIDGAVRGRLRDVLLKGVRCPGDITQEDLQHMWKYGYFLRCLEEYFFDEE
jgi:hypothetical protein